MSFISYENYKKRAGNKGLNDTEIAGRYGFQVIEERRTIRDIINKLDIQATDNLLDIGCGPGNLLIPLSFFVSEACGIDNDAAIERLLHKSENLKNIRGIAGNFLDIDIADTQRYSKILIYDVIQYLSSHEDVEIFLSKALSLLKQDGKMLIGDIPNTDKKRRYENSPEGRLQIDAWKKKIAESNEPQLDLPVDPDLVKTNDNLYISILAIARKKGFESYLLPQPDGLAFNKTRDDILIISKYPS